MIVHDTYNRAKKRMTNKVPYNNRWVRKNDKYNIKVNLTNLNSTVVTNPAIATCNNLILTEGSIQLNTAKVIKITKGETDKSSFWK